MPELPEVETIKRGLKKVVIGKIIDSVEVRAAKVFYGDPKKLIGKEIKNVSRRGKQIIIDIEGKDDILIHLKMTGQLIFEPSVGGRRVAGGHPSGDWVAKLPNSTTRVIFYFSDKSKLFFNDQRKFGWIRIFDAKDLKNKLAEELGVEPFSRGFTLEKLTAVIRSKPRWNIKKILTDQSLISGIGNIYADEALYWARILPEKKASEIIDVEIKKLHSAIVKALKIGLQHGGSSEDTYVKIDGSKGQAQEYFQVYARAGKKCYYCGSTIRKIRLNGRGTHFCPTCQK